MIGEREEEFALVQNFLSGPGTPSARESIKEFSKTRSSPAGISHVSFVYKGKVARGVIRSLTPYGGF